MSYTVGVLLCAAGKGARAGFEKNKLLVPYQGERVLSKTLAAFDLPQIREIVVSCSEVDRAEIEELLRPYPNAKTVLGGETRVQSVRNGLRAVQSDIVLIHDGARPFVSREVIEECIASVIGYGSGVCAVPCSDTVAVVSDGRVQSVPDRKTLWQLQTPQGFFRENILFAHERAAENGDTDFTDDSSLFARYCGKPKLCKGDVRNVKLTYAEDFRAQAVRCGYGIDTHAFGKAQDYITLGGVRIPSDSGLIAHSDGDVLVHALMDALLSAAGLRDIGYYFPDTDARWKNANSMEMLCEVLQKLDERGFAVQNASIAVQAEKPRLSRHIDEMKRNLAAALSVPEDCVGVAAGTNEGLGYVGEGKGITVHAYVLLKNK